jgi:hypothetical protein
MREPSQLPRLFALLVMVLAFDTSASARGFPPVVNGTFPSCVGLVASDGSPAAREFGEFHVFVRDLANNPMPGVAIRVDFSFIPELRIASDQHDPDAIVDCAGKSVTKISDVNGGAVFCIIGSSIPGEPATTLLGGARIYADGFLAANPTANTFDLNGTAGLGAGDLAVFLDDFASGLSLGRSDFNCSGIVSAADLSVWLSALASGSQLVSAVGCP